MAEYGYVKTWEVYFREDAYPHYWLSAGGDRPPATRVPGKFGKQLIDDLFDDFVARNRKYHLDDWGEFGYPSVKIRYNPDEDEWVLYGYSLFWNQEKTEKWLRDNGFGSVVDNNIIRNTPDPTLFDMDKHG